MRLYRYENYFEHVCIFYLHFVYLLLCALMQENFVFCEHGYVYFRDGRKFSKKVRRYVLEHAGCRGKVSVGQMWDFCNVCISNNELGILLNYEKTKKISRRMRRLCMHVKNNFKYILEDVPGIFVSSCILVY